MANIRQTSKVKSGSGTVTQPPAFTVAPTTASLPYTGGTIQFTATASTTVSYSLPVTRSGITINSSTGLVTVASTAAGTSGSITVRATANGMSTDTLCSVTVAAQPSVSGFTADTGYSVTSASGSFADGATITITGSGFTVKTNVKPYLWIPCESNLLPHPILSRTTTALTPAANTVFQTAVAPPNSSGALRSRPLAGTSDKVAFTTEPIMAFANGEMYVYCKKRFDFSADPNNVKTYRIWAAGITVPDGFYNFNIANGYVGHFEQWVYNQAVSTGSHYCGNMLFTRNQWRVEELEYKEGTLNNLDGIFCYWANGLTAHPYTARFKTRDNTYPSRGAWFFLDEWTNTPPNGTSDYMYYNSIYVDDSRHRVFVSNEATFNTAQYGAGTFSNREICIPTAWTDTSVSVVLRQGSHTSLTGKYLYVVNGNGTATRIGQFSAPSSSLVQGQTLTISGAGFGTKPTAGPLVSDDMNHNDAISARWSGAWPNQASDTRANMAYRATPFTRPLGTGAVAINPPHSRHAAKIVAGAAFGSTGTTGLNQILWMTFSRPSFPFFTYARWWERVDSSWVASGDNNFKFFDWSYGNEPYGTGTNPSQNWYYNYGPPVTLSSPGYQVNDDGSGTSVQTLNYSYGQFGTEDIDGRSRYGAGGASAYGWVLREVFVEHRADTNGRVQIYEDGVLMHQYRGNTADPYAGVTRSMAIGGYVRSSSNSNNWRYFGESFMDVGEGWFYLTDNANWSAATIRELQPWTSWADASVMLKVNLGRLPSGTVHLHFRKAPWSTGHQYLGTYTA